MFPLAPVITIPSKQSGCQSPRGESSSQVIMTPGFLEITASFPCIIEKLQYLTSLVKGHHIWIAIVFYQFTARVSLS